MPKTLSIQLLLFRKAKYQCASKNKQTRMNFIFISLLAHIQVWVCSPYKGTLQQKTGFDPKEIIIISK